MVLYLKKALSDMHVLIITEASGNISWRIADKAHV